MFSVFINILLVIVSKRTTFDHFISLYRISCRLKHTRSFLKKNKNKKNTIDHHFLVDKFVFYIFIYK